MHLNLRSKTWILSLCCGILEAYLAVHVNAKWTPMSINAKNECDWMTLDNLIQKLSVAISKTEWNFMVKTLNLVVLSFTLNNVQGRSSLSSLQSFSCEPHIQKVKYLGSSMCLNSWFSLMDFIVYIVQSNEDVLKFFIFQWFPCQPV